MIRYSMECLVSCIHWMKCSATRLCHFQNYSLIFMISESHITDTCRKHPLNMARSIFGAEHNICLTNKTTLNTAGNGVRQRARERVCEKEREWERDRVWEREKAKKQLIDDDSNSTFISSFQCFNDLPVFSHMYQMFYREVDFCIGYQCLVT